jgi:hypothetical protein
LPVKYPQWRSSASNGVHWKWLDTQDRGARFGQPTAGYYGSDASMSDIDPDLTPCGRESTQPGVFSTELDAAMLLA